MTRKDLIDKVAEKFGLKKKEAEAIVKFIFHEIAETVRKGERVSIQGFGAEIVGLMWFKLKFRSRKISHFNRKCLYL